MKIVIATLLLLGFSVESYAINKSVFGNDDRVELNETGNSEYRKWARSTAAMIHNKHISKSGAGYIVQGKLLSEAGITAGPQRGKVCPEMRFANQLTAANCSAFLVGPDLLVTAGHCIADESTTKVMSGLCEDFKWVFDYKLSQKQLKDLEKGKIDSVDNIKVSKRNVYTCKEVISFKHDEMQVIYDPSFKRSPVYYKVRPKILGYNLNPVVDYALIRLDRKVVGRKPLKVRTEGKVSLYDRLVMIGHPLGLPSKVTAGGEVLMNDREHFFNADLDSFNGNSGSAVFNEDTGEIEGILVRAGGSFEYDHKRRCLKVANSDAATYNEEDIEMFIPGINRITDIKELMEYLKN